MSPACYGPWVDQDRISEWLERLSSASPTPGGGAAAALAVASGAALVEMVVNLTLGKAAYAQHAEHVGPIGVQATAARARAIELAAADEEAFESVMAAYRLPRATEAEKATRNAAIQAATAAAAQPPMAVAELAASVIALAAALPGKSNPNVLSDVGVAASLAVSALESSAINVEVNLGALAAGPVRDDLRARLSGHLAAIEDGRRVVQAVRDALSS